MDPGSWRSSPPAFDLHKSCDAIFDIHCLDPLLSDLIRGNQPVSLSAWLDNVLIEYELIHANKRPRGLSFDTLTFSEVNWRYVNTFLSV